MIKKDITTEIITSDDVNKDDEMCGESNDDKLHLYASISAEHKAKKRWVAKLDLSRLVSVIMPGCR